jgi:multidrug resistance efflux pump
LQLREGGYVTSIPSMAAMTFISDYGPLILASFSQSASRYIHVGDPIEIVFTFMPGQIFSGKVSGIARVSGQTQLTPSGQLPTMTGQPETGRWAVRAELEDSVLAKNLPQSAAGTIAVYTDKGKPFHVISKVVMRMQAWLGYLTSP